MTAGNHHDLADQSYLADPFQQAALLLSGPAQASLVGLCG
jgi:hypothetical protein